MLVHYMRVKADTAVRFDGGPVEMRRTLPPEVEFESLAARVRPFTVGNDFLFYEHVLGSLRRMTARRGIEFQLSCDHFDREWGEATRRDNSVRAYVMLTEQGRVSDLELAYSWLYQDSVHGDEVDLRTVGVKHRYEAAVGVFSNIAVVIIEMLHYVNELVAMGFLELPIGTFTDQVVVSTTEVVEQVQIYVSKHSAGEPPDMENLRSIPEGFVPIHEHPDFQRPPATE